MRRFVQFVLAAGLLLHGALTGAVTTAGIGSTIVIPIVASTGSYTSEISVFYPGPFSGSTTSITVGVFYYEANGLGSPGLKSCTPLSVANGQATSFVLASQCSLGSGSHYGLLVLQDAATQKVNTFWAFNRTQSIGTQQGFSVEGFPIGNFSGENAYAIGLKRIAAAPGFATNCFVGSLGEAVNYQVELFDSTGLQLGSTVSASLGAWQLLRYLDIFAAVGAPVGDHTNARARFSVVPNGGTAYPALIAFCTVQDNVYFGADFRIAKSGSAFDGGEYRVACGNGNADCTDVGATPYQITNTANKDAFRLLLRSPDFVLCKILGSQASSLELALLTGGSFAPGGTVLAGGAGQQSFYFSTGARSTRNNGKDGFYNLEIETIASAPTGTYNYSIRCDSGNGTGNSNRVSTGNLRGF